MDQISKRIKNIYLNIYISIFWNFFAQSCYLGFSGWEFRFFICSYQAITQLFNASLSNSFVPHQWKSTLICPIPKVPIPLVTVDYIPISITAVLSRHQEKAVVEVHLTSIAQLVCTPQLHRPICLQTHWAYHCSTYIHTVHNLSHAAHQWSTRQMFTSFL